METFKEGQRVLDRFGFKWLGTIKEVDEGFKVSVEWDGKTVREAIRWESALNRLVIQK